MHRTCSPPTHPHPAGTRLLALLLALLLVLVGAREAGGFDGCPHHAFAAGTEASVGSPHGSAGHAHGPDAPPAPADAEHGCTCVGPCQGGAPALLPALAPGVAQHADAAAAGRTPAFDSPRTSALAFLRPPANAPPNDG